MKIDFNTDLSILCQLKIYKFSEKLSVDFKCGTRNNNSKRLNLKFSEKMTVGLSSVYLENRRIFESRFHHVSKNHKNEFGVILLGFEEALTVLRVHTMIFRCKRALQVKLDQT